jgi:type IV secretory pathway VirB10-like protein
MKGAAVRGLDIIGRKDWISYGFCDCYNRYINNTQLQSKNRKPNVNVNRRNRSLVFYKSKVLKRKNRANPNKKQDNHKKQDKKTTQHQTTVQKQCHPHNYPGGTPGSAAAVPTVPVFTRGSQSVFPCYYLPHEPQLPTNLSTI